MKTSITIIILLLALSSFGQSSSEQTLRWGGKASIGGYAPEGTLIVKDIMTQVDGPNIIKLVVTIDMKSLYHENKQLMNHLKDKDFFHVRKYPIATFTLTEPFTIGTDEQLIGIMTIKDKTQIEKIPVQVTTDKGKISLSFRHSMDRLDYGITYNSLSIFKSLKENAIADAFTLDGILLFIP